MTSARRLLFSHLARFIAADEALAEAWSEAYERDRQWPGAPSGLVARACDRAHEREADRAARALGFASAEVARDLAHRFGISFDSFYRHMGVPRLPGEDADRLAEEISIDRFGPRRTPAASRQEVK